MGTVSWRVAEKSKKIKWQGVTVSAEGHGPKNRKWPQNGPQELRIEPRASNRAYFFIARGPGARLGRQVRGSFAQTNPVSKMFRRSEHCGFKSSVPCFLLDRPREARQLQSGRRREARASRALRFGRGGASRRLRRPKSAFSFNRDVLVKSMTLYKVFTLSHACMFATCM